MLYLLMLEKTTNHQLQKLVYKKGAPV
ncbi:MAG: hypothetical protein ACD_71C00180G0001, partial [uncultured bacterium (gcode 4)]